MSSGNLEFSRGSREHLLLEIPLHLTEKTIISQVRKHLRQHPERKVERISHAERPLAKLIGIKQEVIEIAHQVWKLHHERSLLYGAESRSNAWMKPLRKDFGSHYLKKTKR